MWLILNIGAKGFLMLSPMLLYIICIRMATHTHSYQGDLHTLPRDGRVIPTHQSVVLGKNYRKVPGRFPSQEQLLTQQSRDFYTFSALSMVLIKVSAVRRSLCPSGSLFFSPAQSFSCTYTLASNFNILHSSFLFS